MKRLLFLLILSMFFSDPVIAHAVCDAGDLMKYFNIVFKRVELLAAAIAGTMAILKGASYILGRLGARLEAINLKPVIYLGRIISFSAYIFGIFALGGVPKSVRHKPRFLKFFS